MNELCPGCGVHLANLRESYGTDEHYCIKVEIVCIGCGKVIRTEGKRQGWTESGQSDGICKECAGKIRY